jgi:cytochrome P450
VTVSDSRPTAAGCPVVAFEDRPGLVPAGGAFARIDALQDTRTPAVRAESGYWIFTGQDVILDGMQQADLWSSSVLTPADPNPAYKWIPVMLDPPEHTQWRRLLGGYFSPGRTKSMLGEQHGFARELVEGLVQKGECDFVADFARIFPTSIFLQIMGMPRERLAQFMEWENMILHQTQESDPDRTVQALGMKHVMGYFSTLIADRRANPDPEATDVVSAAVAWEIDGAPVADADILNCLLLLFMAGLDTVASQLAYMLYHLGTHPEDRRRVVAEPELAPRLIEEILRAYPIVQTARKARRDEDFHGCPVKAGDMALFPLAAAGRDGAVYPDARTVDLDREVTRHLSFGAGPHRCLGSHLARQELLVALTEWHRLVPDYEVVGTPLEHAGQMFGLHSLHLRWS